MDTLIYTLTSTGYIDITANLLKSIKDSKVSADILVFCIDDISKKYFDHLKYTTMRVDISKYIPSDYNDTIDYGTIYFQKICFYKFLLMNNLLNTLPSHIRYIIYLDSDIVVLKDFI